MTDMYRSAIRAIHSKHEPKAAPIMHSYYPRQGNREFTACPQLLRDGSVLWSDRGLNPGPLGFEANVLTTTPSRLTMK